MSRNSTRIQDCISLLEELSKGGESFHRLSEDEKIALMKAAGKFSRPDRDEIRKRNREKVRIQKRDVALFEKAARSSTGIRDARKASVFIAPKQIESNLHNRVHLKSPRNCYVCKAKFTTLHFFYDSMCKDCGDLNYQKRFQTAPLTGQVALITGSRLKIGYHVALMLLRAGAKVIATTRFPVDAAKRFSAEEGFGDWGDRLQIHGLDLRHTPSVELFASYIESKYDRLDLLINNAAQTVRRPPGFYAHLMESEAMGSDSVLLDDHRTLKKQLSSYSKQDAPNDSILPIVWHGDELGIGVRESARLSQIPYSYDNSLVPKEVFPEGQLDADLQQVDLRKTNSWRLRLGEIQTSEMFEVQLINSVAPFVLCNRLVSLMKKENTGCKHIVNVSAIEGKFQKFKKADRHPHTNMAKAALNMMTHTSASDFAKHGIHMNAVDTGWVTDEDPIELRDFKRDVHDFQPPLDIVDGAARICDPFFRRNSYRSSLVREIS